MMGSFWAVWPYWLALLVLLLLLAIQGYRLFRLEHGERERVRGLQALEQQHERRLEQFNMRLSALEASLVGVGQRAVAAEQQVRALETRLEQELADRSSGMDNERDGLMAHAARMAARGASVEELTTDFGLSRSEAELMVALKGQTLAGEPARRRDRG